VKATSPDVLRRIEPWMLRFKAFLIENSYSQFATKDYCVVARQFLTQLERKKVAINVVTQVHVDAYLRERLRRYRRQYGRQPRNLNDWHWHYRSPIQALLRLAQGQWPPPTMIDERLRSFRKGLQKAGHTVATIRHYIQVARRFLIYLGDQSVSAEAATQVDISRFIDSELRSFPHKHGRLPHRLIHWRCGRTNGIHALLRLVQKQWPPTSSVHPWLLCLKEHLEQECPDRKTRLHYLHACREFLVYWEARSVGLENIETQHVTTYSRYKLRAYCKRHHRLPPDLHQWRTGMQTPIHRLLRLMHGYWPPDSRPDSSVIAFRDHLVQQGFSPTVIPSHLSTIRVFLRFLDQQCMSVENVRPTHVASYMESTLAAFQRTHRRLPTNLGLWRYGLTGPIHRYLRLLLGKWPPELPITDDLETIRRDLGAGYGRWLTELKGLSPETLRKNGDAAQLFLRWLDERVRREPLRILSLSDIDGFLAWRNPGLRRATRSGVSQCLRSFLHYLYGAGFIAQDLARHVPSPSQYRLENIPSALSHEQVQQLLEVTRQDRKPIGLSYRAGVNGQSSQLLWFDRSGKQLGPVAAPGGYTDAPEISSDGNRVAVDRRDGQVTNIWILELARGTSTRFTFERGDQFPVWSPDGTRVAFSSTRETGLNDLYQKISSGAGKDELLLKTSERKQPTDWSSDGRFLIYESWDGSLPKILTYGYCRCGEKIASRLRSCRQNSMKPRAAFLPTGDSSRIRPMSPELSRYTSNRFRHPAQSGKSRPSMAAARDGIAMGRSCSTSVKEK
jgi:hypothetical protein